MPAHTSTFDELAKELGTTRRSLNSWKLKHDDHPEPKADGRHEVKLWREWMLLHNLKGSADDAATTSEGTEEKSAKEWKAEQEKYKARKLKLEVEQKEGKLLDRSKVEKTWGTALTSFRKASDSIAPRAAKLVSSAMTETEIAEKIREEVDHAMRILEAVDYLES